MPFLRFAVLALFSALAVAQTPPPQTRSLTLSQTDDINVSRSLSKVVRTITDVPGAALDEAGATLKLAGTSSQLAAAEWLVKDLDRPAQTGAQPPAEFNIADVPDSEVRVFYPAVEGAPNLQGLVNTVRTVTDIQRMFPHLPRRAIAVRGTAAQVKIAEWLINALTSPARASISTSYQDARMPDASAVRVSFLNANAQVIQETVNAIRTITDMQRMFPYQGSGAIAWRGSPAQDELAHWLVNEFQRPSGSQEFQASGLRGGGLVRIFHVTHLAAPREIQQIVTQIRNATGAQRLFPIPAYKAFTMRGTPAQIVQAEQLLTQYDIPSAPK